MPWYRTYEMSRTEIVIGVLYTMDLYTTFADSVV